MGFSLNPALDLDALRQAYAERGRIEIRDFLADGQAETLRAHLIAREDWLLVLNAGEKVYEMTRDAVEALTPQQRDQLEEKVSAAGREGFQFRFSTIRVPDAAEARGETLLDQFVSFMSVPTTVNFLRGVTGHADVDFADGQATSYAPGHFLTRHDDDVGGKHRRAAYVLGLAPRWRTEWGGLLMFHGPEGDVEEAFAPAMNALRLFSVPASHSVSYVNPLAPEPRLSVTGWLRASP